jgi:WD40 repeat protein
VAEAGPQSPEEQGEQGEQEENAEAGVMRNGARKWFLRAGHDLRELPAPALLSMLCAATFCPLIPAVAGITGAVAVAGMGILSSVGGGVLTGVITDAIDRLRPEGKAAALSPSQIEKGLAGQIGQVLTAGAAQAAALRAEIGQVLDEIDLGGTLLREAIDSGNEQLRGDLVAAISVLGSDFAELGFLVRDVAAVAARIQQDLDEQRASTRVIIEQNVGQSVEIRRVREDLAVIERRTRPGTPRDERAADAGTRWEGCPYRGLLPFSEADAEIFYGRERLTTDLAVKVAGQMSHGGLIIVTGASGAGKSSLLHAGLLPALARGLQVQGSERWPCRVMTPTNEPLAELATQLAALGGGSALMIADALARDPARARLAARQAVLADDGGDGDGRVRLVLIVDQFEQIFTLNAGPDREADRKRFITALCAMTMNPPEDTDQPPALVVLAVRGDFLDRCAGYAELAAAMQEDQFVVGPMTSSDLRLAITGPADAAGLHLEPSLTETILGDLRAAGTDTAAGVLPLLSQAMLLTWENRNGDRLTSHGYGKSGGISRAIEISADAVYDGLPAASQMLAKEILRNMTTTNRDARFSRRPVTRAALGALPGVGQSQVDVILERFAASRLIVLNEGVAEIAHDALLTAWPRLHGWLDEDQASWMLHSQLADDAEQWRHGRQPDFLYRGVQLADAAAAASTWAANPDRYPALTGPEREFLQVSQRADRRRIRQRWAVMAALAVLFLASLTAAGIAAAAAKTANHQRNLTVYQRDLATSDELAAESEQFDATDLATAAQLAAASWDVMPTAQARASMLDLLAQKGTATFYADRIRISGVNDVALNGEGSMLATAGDDGTARLWDVATHRQIGPPLTASVTNASSDGNVNAVAFSPDGTMLATAGQDGTVRLWDVATYRQIGAPIRDPDGLAMIWVAFSPDGRMLATAGEDGTARLWDVATHRQIGTPLRDPSGLGVNGVAFSPDGRMLATAGQDGMARLWDLATHRQIGGPLRAVSISINDTGVDGVAFSPDGRMLATAGSDGTARLWDVATHRQIGAPINDPSGTGGVNGVVFGEDGTILATAGSDGTARLWDVATHRQIGAPLTAVNGPEVLTVNAVASNADGTILATAGTDGTARLWNMEFGAPIGAPLTAVGGSGSVGVNGVAFSPDGEILATAGSDGTARLWDVTTRKQIGSPLTAVGASSGAGVNGVAFSPDGRILATAGQDGTARLWDVTTQQQIGGPLSVVGVSINGTGVYGVAFSPDGRMLATAASNGAVMWDVATRKQIGAPLVVGRGGPRVNGVYGVAFSPDGKTLATAGPGATVRLWDVATRKQIGAPIIAVSDPGTNGVYGVAFSPDGSTLATVGQDGTARLWDVTTHQQIGASIIAATASSNGTGVSAVAFSPDGRILATAGDDGTARLWDVATHQQIGTPLVAASNGDGVIGVAFSPDGRILATAAGYGAAQLWDTGFPSDLLRAVCAVAGTSLTPQQWHQYVQSAPYQKICP